MTQFDPFSGNEGGSCSGGRPSLFTPERAERVLEAVRRGLHLKQAAAYAGISYSTLNRWRIEGREREDDGSEIWEFWKSLQQANGEAAFRLVGRISDAADNGDWKAATWILERRFRDEWGAKSNEEIDEEELRFPSG